MGGLDMQRKPLFRALSSVERCPGYSVEFHITGISR